MCRTQATAVPHQAHALSAHPAPRHRPTAGSNMITTPHGAERHYTMSYSDFCRRLQDDPPFAAWFQEVRLAGLA